MFKAFQDCQQRQCDKLHAKCSTMSHEERLSFAKRKNSAAMGMIVAGCGCFGGLVGGLWHQMGAGALGVGFGGASGLWFGSCGVFEEVKLILTFDKELMAGNGKEVEEVEPSTDDAA